MSQTTDDLGNPKLELSDGAALYALPYEPSLAAKAIEHDISQKTDSDPQRSTPDPTGEGQSLDPQNDGGPLRRFNEVKSPLGSVGLEALAKDEDEIAKSVATRSDEIYRNEFPVISPKFAAKCENCGAEFDEEEIESCTECGHDTLRAPAPEERREIKELFTSVNKEGQSMRQLGKITEDDHSRLGVLCWVVRWTYKTAPRTVRVDGSPVVEAGDVIAKEFEEVVRGDPKRIVPVVDENGRIGNVWWTCPRHREEAVISQRRYADGHRECKTCGCDLREVFYVELEEAAGRELTKYFFDDEVVMHAGHMPQAHGLDGLSPVHLVWLEQAILHWMDVYAAEYFNPHSERTPNKFLIVHTANPESFERQLDEAKDEAQENPYKSGIFYNQISPQQSASTEAQVIDVMGDEFLGQSHELRKRFESQIRQVFGVTDVFDSELEDAGGLNNEGLQIEVTDRSIAAAQQELKDGPYDQLLSILGYDDWEVHFVPPREQNLDEQRRAVKLLREAAEIGLPARMENGEPVIGDGEAEAPQQGLPPGGGGGQPPDGGPLDIESPDEGGDTGNGSADDGQLEALRELADAQQHLLWPDLDGDVDQKAREPFWDRDEEMPEFVKEVLQEAIDSGAIGQISRNLPPSVNRTDVEQYFRDKLQQPQGWSLESLANEYAERFDVAVDEAVQAVRRQTKAVLDKGREIGYREQGDMDERRFKWIGPIDDRKTDASWEVLEKTNPDHGGTPRPLDELKEIVAEAREKHFPELTGAEWADGWQDRDTYVEHFE